MKKRFSEEQIIKILKSQEAGLKTAEVCRGYGISEATFYKWSAKIFYKKIQNPLCFRGNFAILYSMNVGRYHYKYFI